MEAGKYHLGSDGSGGHVVRKILTALSQLVIVLLVWEFLRSSRETTDNGDDFEVHLNRKSVNLLDCFPSTAQGGNLDFDSIISRNKTINSSKQHRFLSVDIIIRTPGSDSVTIYTAGTQVTGGDDNSNQLWKIDYFEYNDEDIPNNVINNDSENPIHSSISQLEVATSNDRVLKADLQSRSDTSSSKLVLDSIDPNLENGKQLDAPQTDREVIDVMLVQDQMLKVRPRDQLRQQQILQRLKKRNDSRHLLHSRGRQITADNLQKVALNSLKTIDQNEPNQEQQQHHQVVAPQTRNITHGYPNQNFTKGLPHSWSDIAIDETSEPLYTDGFLERVQRVKAQLYQHKLFYDRKFKGKVNKLYLLNNSSKCQGLSTVHVVYLINSQPESTEQRQLLRQTVLKSNSFHSFNIVHVFLMGKSSSHELQEKLKFESQLYGDIVQGDFEDTAQKSAWKVLMGMRWILRFCTQVHFVLKMNENVFVDTDKLVRGLIPASVSVTGKRSMFCALSSSSSSNLTLPFCEGFAVVMSRHLVCSIVAASNQIRVPVVEDYYLYGALPFVTGGVEVYNLGGKHGFQKNGDEALFCYRNHKDKCPILATQTETGGFKYLWDMAQRREDKSGRWSNLWDLRSVQSYLS